MLKIQKLWKLQCILQFSSEDSYQIEKKRHGLVLMGTISIESSSGHNGPSGLIQNHHVNPSAFLRFNIFKYCCAIDGD